MSVRLADLARIANDPMVLNTAARRALRARFDIDPTDVVRAAQECTRDWAEEGGLDPASLFLAGFDIALRAVELAGGREGER